MNHIASRRAFNVQVSNTLSEPVQFGHPTTLKSNLYESLPGNKENDIVKINSKFENKFSEFKVTKKASGIPVPLSKQVGAKLTHSGIPLANSRVNAEKRSQTSQISKNLSQLQLTPKIDDIDKVRNCNFMTEYAIDIYNYLRELEDRWSISKGFMNKYNPAMSGQHRAMIIDWIFRFDRMFDVTADTYYIATSIFDRFVALEPLSRKEYQCVALSSFHIACKFEEVYFPTIKDLVSMCEDLYSKNDFLNMEIRILKALKFDLGRPYSLQFLRRYSRAAKAGSRVHMMAKYFCELSLVYYQLAHIKPSMIAAGALYLSLRLNAQVKSPSIEKNESNVWTPTLEHYSTYKRDQLIPSISLMAHVILNSENSKQQQCRQKFSQTKCFEVAKLTPSMKRILENYSKKVSDSPK